MTHYHFIGIGGTGLSAIARVLVEKGHTVSGSDKVLSPQAQELQSIGVRVETGHDAKNVAGADIVIRSSAVRDENPEVIAARNAGIPVLKRYQMLAELTRGTGCPCDCRDAWENHHHRHDSLGSHPPGQGSFFRLG